MKPSERKSRQLPMAPSSQSKLVPCTTGAKPSLFSAIIHKKQTSYFRLTVLEQHDVQKTRSHWERKMFGIVSVITRIWKQSL